MSLGSILEIALGVIAGGAINWLFSRRASKELREEAAQLRRLTVNITQILEGQGIIEVTERDPSTDEPTRWPAGANADIRHGVEAPTPRWKLILRRVSGR